MAEERVQLSTHPRNWPAAFLPAKGDNKSNTAKPSKHVTKAALRLESRRRDCAATHARRGTKGAMAFKMPGSQKGK